MMSHKAESELDLSALSHAESLYVPDLYYSLTLLPLLGLLMALERPSYIVSLNIKR